MFRVPSPIAHFIISIELRSKRMWKQTEEKNIHDTLFFGATQNMGLSSEYLSTIEIKK